MVPHSPSVVDPNKLMLEVRCVLDCRYPGLAEASNPQLATPGIQDYKSASTSVLHSENKLELLSFEVLHNLISSPPG